jgi:GntR family transcriptional regulator, N-acetylglucosamine utilization regulator
VILDRRSAVPLYYQIYQQLLEQIRSGTLQPGQPIPSETEIVSSLGVSRMTARQAVKTLCDTGVTYSQRGLGTFVSGSKQEKTSTELLSFTQETKARGVKPASRVLVFEEVSADLEAARALHLPERASVVRLKRVRMADSVPMSIEESFLSAKMFPSLLEIFEPRTSLYEVLAKRYGIRMTAADEVAEAALASSEDARLLQIENNSPVFALTRISYNQGNQPVEFVRSIYRGDRWKLVSRLTVNQKDGANTLTRTPVVAITPITLPQRRQERGVSNRRRPKDLRQFNQKKGAL